MRMYLLAITIFFKIIDSNVEHYNTSASYNEYII